MAYGRVWSTQWLAAWFAYVDVQKHKIDEKARGLLCDVRKCKVGVRAYVDGYAETYVDVRKRKHGTSSVCFELSLKFS